MALRLPFGAAVAGGEAGAGVDPEGGAVELCHGLVVGLGGGEGIGFAGAELGFLRGFQNKFLVVFN